MTGTPLRHAIMGLQMLERGFCCPYESSRAVNLSVLLDRIRCKILSMIGVLISFTEALL